MNATYFQVRKNSKVLGFFFSRIYTKLMLFLGFYVQTLPLNVISAISSLTVHGRFIEENNAYKNAQKEIQRNQRPLPGMPSQDVMAYWGNI